MTARAGAVEVLRLACEELQPPGRHIEETRDPEWSRVALASPENAQAIAVEVRALCNDAGRLARDLVREAEKRAAGKQAPPQLGLFG